MGDNVSVYKAINAVQSDLAKVGISKDSTNSQQNYKFRGIDAVYNALAPLLAKHGLCILPRVLTRDVVERVSAKGAALFYITVHMDFDFVASEDGSKHTVTTCGEAMDSGDKATNKAMSAAYKYACMQAFSIPTEGDNDADAHTHEVSPAVRISPVANALGDWFQQNPDQLPALRELAADLVQAIEKEDAPVKAHSHLVAQNLDNEQKLALWSILGPNSKTRTALKKQAEAVRNGAK